MVHLQESLTQKFIKRGSWLYFFAFLSGPIGYAIKIIISHDLSVAELGILYGVLSFILLIGSLNDFGMVESLNHFIPKFVSGEKPKKVKAFFIYGGAAMLITSLISGGILYVLSDYLARVYFGEIQAALILKYFCFFLIFSNIQHYFSTVFIVYQNTKFSRGIEALRLIISLGFAYQAFLSGTGNIVDYASLWNYGVAATVLFGGYYAWKLHLREVFASATFEFSKADMRELFGYSLWALLANNATLLLSQIDTQLLLVMRGAADVGIYSNYLSLVGIPFILLTPIMGLITPVVSAYYGANRPGEIVTITSTFSRIFTLLGMMTVGIVLLFAPGSGIFFFGDKFLASGYVLYYSIAFITFNFLLQINFSILAAIGKVKKRLRIIGIGLIVNIVLNIICIHFAGVYGSAFAVGTSWIVIWTLSYFATREFHAPFFWKIFFKNFIFYTILTIVLWLFLPRDIAIIGRFGYFFSLAFATLLYAGGFILLNKEEYRHLLHTFKNKKSGVSPLS